MVTFVGLASAASAFASNTYYVSKSAGSDANAGTSKSAPWAHIPGMASCTGSTHCGTYSPAPGDTFILMGCDVWTNSDLPVLWNWSGSSGSPITIGGEDKTWYNTTNCPSAWNRPILNAGGAGLNPNVMFRAANVSNTSYVTLDNIEFKGLYCQGANSANPYYCGDGTHSANTDHIACYDNCTNWTFSNLYFHGWNTTDVNDGYDEDDCTIFHGSASMTGTTFTQNVIDGSDATDTCYAMYPSFPPTVTNNVVHNLVNGFVGSVGTGNTAVISGNLVYNILYNGIAHNNSWLIEGGGTHYFYDNVTHDALGENFNLSNANVTAYAWNNVWYNITGNPPDIDSRNGNITARFWNNTIVAGGSGACFMQCWSNASCSTPGSYTQTVLIENTHCIGTSLGVSGAGYTLNNNLLQPIGTVKGGSDANSSTHFDQYTASQTYAYSPLASTNSTVGAGKQICGVEETCTGNFAALAVDTTYAVSYNATMQTATVQARTSNARPPSGAWDAGAFQYASSGTSSGPQPPANLQAVVH